jgi:SDR family mycofactocin-dependent oxidoreductase
MAGRLEGKVALITGAAWGQGRSHAVRFAEEGADIIAVDLCQPIDSVSYALPVPADLEETERLVEKTGRRIVASLGDVRDFAQMADIVKRGVEEFGRLDFVLANAGIMPLLGDPAYDFQAWRDAIDIMLSGAYYTIEAALPTLLAQDEGGAIVITSSYAGLKAGGFRFDTMSHGAAGYASAKHGVVGLMRYYANGLGEKNIRVNTVNPTGVSTPMIMNEQFAAFAAAHPSFGQAMQNLLPVPVVEPVDVSEAMIYLCAESGRYITGITLSVDAGLGVK